MWIFKEALEKAGVRRQEEGRRGDPHHGHASEGSAKFFPGGRMKFDEAGRRVDADLDHRAVAERRAGDGLPGGLGGGEADLAEAVKEGANSE